MVIPGCSVDSLFPSRLRVSRMAFSCEASSGFHAVNEDDTLLGIDFLQSNLDDFRGSGLDVAAHILCFNGHLPMAAINQNA